MAESRQADHEAVADICDMVLAKVTSMMRGTPVVDLATTDEDSGLEEEAVTAPKRRALKSD